MKKTLTTLALAAVSVATAATVGDYAVNGLKFANNSVTMSGSHHNILFDGGNLSEAWALSFTMTQVSTYNKAFLSMQTTTSGGDTVADGMSVKVTGADGEAGTYTMAITKLTAGGTIVKDGLTFSAGDTIILTMLGANVGENTAKTLYLTNATTGDYITTTTSLPSITTIQPGTSHAWSFAAYKDSAGGPNSITLNSLIDLNAAKKAIIAAGGDESEVRSAITTYATTGVMTEVAPEPATVTLSLLALAGLASRRRRI